MKHIKTYMEFINLREQTGYEEDYEDEEYDEEYDEEDDDIEIEDEPEEEDAYISSTGRLGGKTSVSISGEFLGEYPSEAHAKLALRQHMEKERYFPNVWYESDHGNHTLIQLESEEELLKQVEEEES